MGTLKVKKLRQIDKIVENRKEELSEKNNLIFQGIKTLTPKGDSRILLEGIVDGDGRIELVATQLKQIGEEVFKRSVHLQAFVDDNGKIDLIREIK